MAPNVVLWVRAGERDSDDAVAFLKANRYGADEVRDLGKRPPDAVELAALAKAVGGDAAALVDGRHPRAAELVPHGGAPLTLDGLAAVLRQEPRLLKAPILVTPRGGLAGFRESRWRSFLDIGKGRS